MTDSNQHKLRHWPKRDPILSCKHDGYLSSSHSRLKAELKCMKCGKVLASRG